MPRLARAAAFVDPSGALRSAEPAFLRELGLPGRAPLEPGLAAFLRGEGPATLALTGAGGQPLLLERQPGTAGHLLVLRDAGEVERLEHASRARGLAMLVGGLAHDVNGPLNTMTLQLELLAEKLDGDPAAALVAGQLGALRAQVARVHGLVRRFREAVDPSGRPGGLDLAALVADLASLLTHELQRRELQLAVEVPAGQARTGAPPAPAVRLVLALLTRAVASAPAGSPLRLGVVMRPGGPVLEVRHAGVAAAETDDDLEVAAEAAAALGGRLDRTTEGAQELLTLHLPGEGHR